MKKQKADDKRKQRLERKSGLATPSVGQTDFANLEAPVEVDTPDDGALTMRDDATERD